jgi:hypothetical protein
MSIDTLPLNSIAKNALMALNSRSKQIPFISKLQINQADQSLTYFENG